MKYVLIITFVFSSALFSQAAPDDFFTRDFPEPDRAEVLAANSPTDTNGPKVEFTKDKARLLAKMLRAQKWTGPASACDKSQYILRFCAGHKLIAASAICFHCGCFAPISSDVHANADPVYFDTESAPSRKLQAMLKTLFEKAK